MSSGPYSAPSLVVVSTFWGLRVFPDCSQNLSHNLDSADIGLRVLLDPYSRRHEAQKIYLRQCAAQRWISYRDGILQGQRPHARHAAHLAMIDQRLQDVRFDPEYCSMALLPNICTHGLRSL